MRWLRFFVATAGITLGASGQLTAATISVDTVIGADFPFQQETITVVDGIEPPTDVSILDGVLLGTPSGPVVDTALELFGLSRVNMQGGVVQGSIESVALHDRSAFRMSGGSVSFRPIVARDMSRVVLDGGDWRQVQAYDASRVEVNGGIVAETFSVRTFGESHAVLNDAFLSLIADEASTAVVNGGVFERAQATGNAAMLVNGGHFVVGIGAFGNAVVRVRSVDGYADEEPLLVRNHGNIHVYGTGLRFDTHPFNDRPAVIGNLADGEPFLAEYEIRDQGQIILHEVPEPAAWALLAIGAAGGAFFRRRRRVAAVS